MKSKSKKKFNKYLTGIASAALVASVVAPVVTAADFTDVADNNSHKECYRSTIKSGCYLWLSGRFI